MSNLPSIDGFKGSHHFLRHADGRVTVIPVHAKEAMGIGLFHKILKDCDLTVKEFMRASK